MQITLNVFAEFIGGVIYPENALAMNYFKSYGVVYVSVSAYLAPKEQVADLFTLLAYI